MHIIKLNEKEAMNLKERKKGNKGGIGGKKGNSNKRMLLSYNLNQKKKT